MLNLLKHLRDQLLYDEDAVKIRLAAFKTWLFVLGAHVLIASGGTMANALLWGKKEWAAALLTACIAAGARASEPVTPKPLQLVPPPAPQ